MNQLTLTFEKKGHAGIEAAVASSKLSKTMLITLSKSNIGTMSCNPSVG